MQFGIDLGYGAFVDRLPINLWISVHEMFVR